MASPSAAATARMQANLRLLQRTISPSITAVIQSATHVVLYEFGNGAWQKTVYEGTLFLAQQNNTASYLWIILNRNSTDNFVLNVSPDFQLQIQDPYLMFRQKLQGNQGAAVRGIWFHNANERISMAQALQDVVALQQQQTSTAPPPAPVPAPTKSYASMAGATTATGPAVATAVTATAAVASTPTVAPAAAAATPQMDPAAAVSALLSTASLEASSQLQQQPAVGAQSPSEPANASSQTLDKKALQLALLSLVQDDRFLDLLHAQYLRVQKARASRQQNHNNS